MTQFRPACCQMCCRKRFPLEKTDLILICLLPPAWDGQLIWCRRRGTWTQGVKISFFWRQNLPRGHFQLPPDFVAEDKEIVFIKKESDSPTHPENPSMTAVFSPAAVAAKRKWSARKPTCSNQNLFPTKSKHTPVDSSNRGVGYSRGPAEKQYFNCFFFHASNILP